MTTANKTTQLSGQSILDMRKVAEAIISIKVEPSDTIEGLHKKFFSVMRKYGIKEGTTLKNGCRQCNTPEWTMCLYLFEAQIKNGINLAHLIGSIQTPKSLLSY